MAVYTTELSVKSILGDHYDDSTDLKPFIDTANVFTLRVVAADTDSDMTDAALEKLEAHLSAHFYAQADQIEQSSSVGKASGQFQGQTALGFDGTLYGQTAKRIDATGLLVLLDQPQRPKAGCTWLGKVRSDRLDEDVRVA